MNREKELLFDELYEKTKDCGRVQFINLLMEKEREIKELKEQVSYLRRDIERKETQIIYLEDERVPYTNKYVDKVMKVHNKATDFIKEYRKNRNVFKWNEQDYIDVIDEIGDILKEVE